MPLSYQYFIISLLEAALTGSNNDVNQKLHTEQSYKVHQVIPISLMYACSC